MVQSRVLVAFLALLALAVAACSTGNDREDATGAGPITFWTGFIEPERIEIQRQIIADFTERTEIEVELVPVAEDELPSLMVANAASGTLPDVVYHPIDFAIGWAEQGLLDTEAAAAVVEDLGPETFNQRALELASSEERPVTVPADAWGQLLIYRTDLFQQAGLQPPDTYERIMRAAQRLHDPANSLYGIAASTDPADVFTQQSFEHFALANDCRLVDDEGQVALGSPQCIESIAAYRDLIAQYSPGSVQNVDSTRSTYFAGQAAMLVWSPFILDELAGLRSDVVPNCPQCAQDPLFLARNSGLVSAFTGPSAAQPSQYGQVAYLGIGAGGNTAAAQDFIMFLLTDGYLDWLSIAPEGQFPMRTGTSEEPERFLEGWRALEIGVDERAPVTEIYGEQVIETLVAGTERFDRWGFAEGYGALVASLYESLVVPQTLSDVLNEGLAPEAAAERLEQEASEQLEALPG
jgi:multiple sugar transport system substrate-binding protein